MAQSRVQQGKGKKSKFPMWGIGIVVVLVVAIAGYAIVRNSWADVGIGDPVKLRQAKYYVRTTNNGLYGGVGNVSKDPTLAQSREVGNIPVYANYTINEAGVDIANYNSTFPPKACVYFYAKQNTRFLVKVTGNYYPNSVLGSQPNLYTRPISTGWGTLCVTLPKTYFEQVVYAAYATRQDVITKVTVSESDPVQPDSFVAVQEIYLTK